MDGREVIDRAVALGAQMNGHPERAPAAVTELKELLADATDPVTVAEIIQSLGVARSDAARAAVLPYWDHSDAGVRLAVAQALPSPDDSALTRRVADTLTHLCSDESAEVRDWATFALGSQLDFDTRAVRSTLMERLDDSSDAVRDEALRGLVRRHDPSIVEVVRERLTQDRAEAGLFEAARYLAHPSLFPVLQEWSAALPGDGDVLDALDACDPERQGQRQALHQELVDAVQRGLDEHQRGTVAVLFCERLSDEVLLGCGDLDQVWFVPALLADGDAQEAARRVVTTQ